MKHSRAMIAGLLLAAGSSTRMGRSKQLLEVGGDLLVGRILREALNSDLDLTVLVLGYKAEKIRKELKPYLPNQKLKVIINGDYRDGISSSIVAGLSKVEDAYDHIMIILADMPHISSSLINLLIRQYLTSRLPLGAITIRAKRSHPVIFGRELYHELHKLQADVGARDLFRKYSDRVCFVEPEDFYDDIDIDTPQDYIEFKNSLRER